MVCFCRVGVCVGFCVVVIPLIAMDMFTNNTVSKIYPLHIALVGNVINGMYFHVKYLSPMPTSVSTPSSPYIYLQETLHHEVPLANLCFCLHRCGVWHPTRGRLGPSSRENLCWQTKSRHLRHFEQTISAR
jgi:hypothetical protein